MNRSKAEVQKIVEKHLGWFGSPSLEEMEDSQARTFQRLLSNSATANLPVMLESDRVYASWRLRFLATVAVTALVVAVLIRRPANETDAYAVVERTEAGLSLAQGPELHAGDRVEFGKVVRTNAEGGAFLRLTDGSRLEVRARSELLLEASGDGTRIRLNSGGVIVNAAKQRTGQHLYVQTKDVTVSVVGTVFLVNAEAEGSRVAVIEGEVRVQQGVKEKKLRSGDQVTSNPQMEALPMKDEIAWSSSAQEHVALLQRSAVPRAFQEPTEQAETFEAASVRPSGNSVVPGTRGGGAPRPCSLNGPPQINPGRLVVNGASLYNLITWAYGLADGFSSLGCETVLRLNLLSGGPEWIKSERFDIEATIPEGTPLYTEAQLIRGQAVKLQRMLQALLAQRFKLVLHPETKEMPVYLMTWTGGQAPRKASRDAAQWLTEKPKDWPWEGRQAYIVPQIGPRDREMLVWKGSLSAAEASISDLAPVLGRIVGLPVSDRTGDIGLVNFHIEFPVDAPPNNSPVGGILNTSDRNSLFKALEKEIGLKFDASRVPVEILVVDSAEKLVEN